MAYRIGSLAVGQTIQRMTAPVGVNAALASMTTGEACVAFDLSQIRPQNVAADLIDRSDPVAYPLVNVYCEKIVNSLAEKFRSFSGALEMAVEIRHSQEKPRGLQDALELYTDAVMQVLDTNRGAWGSGLYYTGGYAVTFAPVKKGGKNYIQSAKITFQLGVSLN